MIEFLTHAQVRELTGAGTKAGQIQNLKKNGIRHSIKRNGWPAVTTDAVTAAGPAVAEKTTWTPRLAG